jgi:hypothetical protein
MSTLPILQPLMILCSDFIWGTSNLPPNKYSSSSTSSKIKVHDSKHNNKNSKGLEDNIVKEVQNSLKEAGINIDLVG